MGEEGLIQQRIVSSIEPPPSCRRCRAFALKQPSRCCHRAAATALLPPRCCRRAVRLRLAAITAAPPPSCRRRHVVALPPPPLPPTPRLRSLVGCCVVVRCPISSSHAVMRPSTLSLPAAFANKLSSTASTAATAAAAGPPQPPLPPPWSNSPSHIGEERGSSTYLTCHII